jgi:hypothetical protein
MLAAGGTGMIVAGQAFNWLEVGSIVAGAALLMTALVVAFRRSRIAHH